MIAALVLAAGPSSRMGRQKMLLDWGGEPLVRRAAREALRSRADSVVVVIGADAPAVRAALADLPITIVENPDHAAGMSTSLRAGARAVPDADAVIVVLADQPAVVAAHLDSLIAAWESGARIAAAAYEDVLGPPALFDRAYFAELDRLTGDEGARRIVEAHREVAVAISIPSAAFDLDTPDDLADHRGTAQT